MAGLTFRERMVLRLLVGGRSPAEIADALESSIATVNLHLRSIQRKAKLEHRYQIIPWILQNPTSLARRGLAGEGLHPYDPGCTCVHCWLLKDSTLVA